MTPRRWAFIYLATAASMAALGAATAVAVVALEERAGRRLGDGEMPTGNDLVSNDSTYTIPDRRDPLANSVQCDHDCTCHGRRAGE